MVSDVAELTRALRSDKPASSNGYLDCFRSKLQAERPELDRQLSQFGSVVFEDASGNRFLIQRQEFSPGITVTALPARPESSKPS